MHVFHSFEMMLCTLHCRTLAFEALSLPVGDLSDLNQVLDFVHRHPPRRQHSDKEPRGGCVATVAYQTRNTNLAPTLRLEPPP